MSGDDPYVRIYWRFADEYPQVYENDAAFALYGRLLRLADMAWPSNATLPFGIKKAALAVLTRDWDGGGPLIQLVTGFTFRVRGMDKEREKRTQSARHAAGTRWGIADRSASGNAGRTTAGNAERIADRIASGNAETMPSRDRAETEKSQGEGTRAPDDDPAVALHERTGTFPTGRVLEWVNELGAAHGDLRLAAAIRQTPMTGTDVRVYLRGVRDGLRLEDRAAERAEAADEKRRLAEKRAQPEPTRVTDSPEYRRILTEISKPVRAAQ